MSKLTTKIRLLDERCMPERKNKGEWYDLKFYQIERIFKAYTTSGSEIANPVRIENHIKISRTMEVFAYNKGDIFRVSLGVVMELPEGYEAEVRMRSSTRKQFNVRLTNAVGTIDHIYKGNNDIWLAEFEAIDSGEMNIGERILQFRIVKEQPDFNFEVVDNLDNEERGGYGSSGK